ncbi:ras 3 [Brachionus plicatilis]|uniref:Ras 3 n=1 Tax=Brachionus plicatilis TaxID=10195 RepID=A0A3M7RJI9_BRAPC|nr:ras 3 [Brachionus plicatilis]
MLNYKIILMGSGGVGKSALTQRFISGNFVEAYDPTIEDCYQKTININDETCKLEILDTAGTEQFSSMRDVYIKSGDAFVIVYSINSTSTFNDISSIIEQINSIKDSDPAPIIIVGNKSDLDDEREVDEELGQTLAKSTHSSFIEASAKLNSNVNEIFYDLLRQLANKRKSMQPPRNSFSPKSSVVYPRDPSPKQNYQKSPQNVHNDSNGIKKKSLCDKCTKSCTII